MTTLSNIGVTILNFYIGLLSYLDPNIHTGNILITTVVMIIVGAFIYILLNISLNKVFDNSNLSDDLLKKVIAIVTVGIVIFMLQGGYIMLVAAAFSASLFIVVIAGIVLLMYFVVGYIRHGAAAVQTVRKESKDAYRSAEQELKDWEEQEGIATKTSRLVSHLSTDVPRLGSSLTELERGANVLRDETKASNAKVLIQRIIKAIQKFDSELKKLNATLGKVETNVKIYEKNMDQNVKGFSDWIDEFTTKQPLSKKVNAIDEEITKAQSSRNADLEKKLRNIRDSSYKFHIFIINNSKSIKAAVDGLKSARIRVRGTKKYFETAKIKSKEIMPKLDNLVKTLKPITKPGNLKRENWVNSSEEIQNVVNELRANFKLLTSANDVQKKTDKYILEKTSQIPKLFESISKKIIEEQKAFDNGLEKLPVSVKEQILNKIK